MGENDITVAKSIFDPTLTIKAKRDVSESPTVNQLIVGDPAVEISTFKRESNTVQATVAKLLETGGILTLDF